MNRINIFYFCIFFILSEVSSAQIRVPKISIEDFSGTEEQANEKKSELLELIKEAEALGIDANKEKMSVKLADVFLVYANWDEQNEVLYTELFDGVHEFHETTAENLAKHLATYERSEVITVLNEAISTLKSLINGEITRKPIPVIDWSKISYDKNKLVYNGRPVFLADYTWQPEMAGAHDVSEFFGDYGSFYFSPNMVKNENGEITTWINNTLNGKPTGNFGTTFIGQSNIPNWLEIKYPKIRNGEAYYTKYDISNPGATEIMEKLLAGIVPKTKGKNYTKQGYMLTNEPHWNLSGSWAVVDLSDNAIDSLKVWLKNKHNNIANLNAKWSKSYASFDDVSVITPIPASQQGGAMWYDVMKFNQDRVTNWFGFIDKEVKKHDPDAKTHIKLIPGHWGGNVRYHGLDFEALTNLTANIGNDAGTKNSWRWGGKQSWESRYHFFWRDMSMTYDFFRSVSPDKVNYNSEGHFLQSVAFTDLFLDPNYVRSAYWLATLQGMNSVQSWFWPRLNDGSLKSDGSKEELAGSAINQPRVVNEIASTMMDLNSHSEHIDALQHKRQPIRIFYSETSAINKGKHMDDVFQLYEALYFEGVSIGFATEKIINNQNNSLWDIIVVHKTEYVTLKELEALQNYLNNGGTVILDATSLKKDEYGKNHSIGLNTNNGGSIITASELTVAKEKAFNYIADKGSIPKITLEETNSLNLKGCVWKAYTNADEENIISIVNIGKTEANLVLGLRDVSNSIICTNLLTGEKLDASFSMAPETVYLLSVKERTAEDNKFTLSTTSETCVDQDNGKIEITAEFEQDYKVVFNGATKSFSKEILIENIAPGNYKLCINTGSNSIGECYNFEIKEAQDIAGKSKLKSKKLEIEMEKGTAPFKVVLNNEIILETFSKSFSVNVEDGDVVKIKTNKICEGLIEKRIDLFGSIKAYPNPSSSSVEINMPNELNQVVIGIYDLRSRLISSKNYLVESGKVQLNIEDLPKGVYFAKLLLEKPVNIKIIKN